MPILEYFKKDVRRALEEKLADDSMFRSIRGTCLRVMNDAKEIKLHPTELYYLAFCVIDRMKGQSTSQAEFYSKDEAWYEYDEVLRDIYGGDSDHERHSALALIIQTCAEWLLRSRDMSRLGIVSNLKLQIAYHISEEFSRRLDEEFRRGFCYVDEISQTLNPSNGTVKYKFKPLMEKLLDGKEIELFIHDLTQELMEIHQ